MNKKGFTLVELVAVVVILSLIALIALPVLLNSIRDNKDNISEATTKIIYTATDLYLDTYMTTYPKINGNTYCVSLSTLVDSGDLAPNLYDVNTNSNVDMTKMVRVDVVEGKYEYKIVDIHECEVKKCDFEIGHTWEFSYTGSEQSFAVPCDGTYMIETWGAQGGYGVNTNTESGNYFYKKTDGGYGAYSVGNIDLTTSNNLSIVVGGMGTSTNGPTSFTLLTGGYNGGGNGYIYSGGGGATHIAFTNRGVLANFSSYKNEIIIVAGGGGGTSAHYEGGGYCTGGHAGGFIGNYGISGASRPEAYNHATTDIGFGGTQISGASFGAGFTSTSSSSISVAGGGGGYYGGNIDNDPQNSWLACAGGGSGYIGNSLLTNKSMYCYNCQESSDESTKTISTTNVSSNPISNYAKEGNGYAKITLINY